MKKYLKKVNYLFLFLILGTQALIAGPNYTNNIREYWNVDSNFDVFRVKKSNNAIQMLDYLQIPLTGGIINTGIGAFLGFGNSASSPTLVLDTAADGEFSLLFPDNDTASVSFQLVMPSNYNDEGAIIFKAVSETNVATSTFLSVRVSINNGTPVTLTETAIGALADTSISTDVSGLNGIVAGDKLSIQIGKNDVTSGTGTLVIHSIGFQYNEDIPHEN